MTVLVIMNPILLHGLLKKEARMWYNVLFFIMAGLIVFMIGGWCSALYPPLMIVANILLLIVSITFGILSVKKTREQHKDRKIMKQQLYRTG